MQKKTTVILLTFTLAATFSVGCGGKPNKVDTGSSKKNQVVKRDTNHKPTTGNSEDSPATLSPDGDEDGDGIKNSEDKCPLLKSSNNADFDGDGVGDACDNCPRTPNAPDLPGETQVNVCQPYELDSVTKKPTNTRRKDFVSPVTPLGDGDKDSDGINDKDDNCPDQPNPNQDDKDHDGVGDLCDLFPDFPNPRNNLTGLQPNYCKPNQPDYDDSKLPYIEDSDGDGIKDAWDNCKKSANADQLDTDKDGIGDACDNCPLVPNASQANSWKTGDPSAEKDKGDACKSYPVGARCESNGAACPNVDSHTQVCATDILPNGILPAGDGVCVCDAKKADVHILRPRVMLLLDSSSSMKLLSRQAIAKNALDAVADAYADKVDFGVMFFGDQREPTAITNPIVWQRKYSSDYDFMLSGGGLRAYYGYTLAKSVGRSDASNIKQYWAPMFPATGLFTPTSGALKIVREEHLLGKKGDKDAEGREIPRLLILLTDGKPILADRTKNEAQQLYNDGVEVYVVGVNFESDQSLKDCANAGSGGKRTFFNATDTASLTTMLKTALSGSLSCELALSNADHSNNIFVYMNDKLLKRGGLHPDYSYDSNTGLITLGTEACKILKGEQTPKFAAVAACPEQCVPSINPKTNQPFTKSEPESSGGIEFCLDGIDNNCDGQVDEGCEGIQPEICGDNIDNDHNGEVDEGCPTKKFGEDCKNSRECLGLNECRDGKCRPVVCHVNGQECIDNSDCCGGQCIDKAGKKVCKLLLG